MKKPPEDHPAGALKCERGDETIVTYPHSPMYSTATMVATHYWHVEKREWLKILDDNS